MVSPQLPSMLQGVVGPFFGQPAVAGFPQQASPFGFAGGFPQQAFPQQQASPFGAGGGFPPLGAFQGIGSAQILAQFGLQGGIPTIPQGFMVGGPTIGGLPAGGGQLFGAQPGFGSPFPTGIGAQPQVFNNAAFIPNLSTGTPFGSPVGGFGGVSPFGLNTASPFGVPQAAAFGVGASPFSLASASPFGSPVGGSPLGQPISASLFGPPVGSVPLGAAPFGGSPFGPPVGASPFGASPFGAPVGASPLGSPLGATPLQVAGGFPGASPVGFGQPSPLGFGQPSPFGLPQQPPFGQPPLGDPQTSGSFQLVQMMMQMMMMMMTLLTQFLGRGGARPAFDAGQASIGGAGGAGNAGGSMLDAQAAQAALNAAPNAASPTLTNRSANAAQGAQLDRSLAAIASDPEGAKLLAAARAKGVTIEVGDPGAAGLGAFDAGHANCPGCSSIAADGSTVVNGVTISQGDQSKIIVRDPNNIKTIVHELVHAVSTGDGNSLAEEGVADVVGSRVANRLGGAAVGGLSGSEQQIFITKQQFYSGLAQNNGIQNTLATLGINAFSV